MDAKGVHTIVTDLAVFNVDSEKGLTLRMYSSESSADEISKRIAAVFEVAICCKTWEK